MHEEVQERPSRLRRWVSQLLDGENRWGYVRIQVDRFGVTRYCLVVYPPGISDTERRRLRVWRGTPIWGATLWVVAELLLQQAMGPWAALTISSSTVLVLAAVALLMAGGMRTRVRTMCVVTMPGLTDSATLAARHKLHAMALTLVEADERVDTERMSPIDH